MRHKRQVPILVLALAAVPAAYGQRICSAPFPYPRIPVQYNFNLPALAGAQNAKTPTKIQVTPLTNITPPRDRFLMIDNIAFKGTHPANAYVAIELRTTTSVASPLTGQSVGPPLPAQQVWTRHFLYGKSSQSDSSAISLRIPVNIYGAPGMPVYIGVQSSAGASLEQLDLTVTGYWIDACRWGQ